MGKDIQVCIRSFNCIGSPSKAMIEYVAACYNNPWYNWEWATDEILITIRDLMLAGF